MNVPLRVKILFIFVLFLFGVPGIALFAFGVYLAEPVMLVFGTIMALVALIPAYMNIRKYLVKQSVLKRGELIMAQCVDVNPAYYDLFGWRPFIVTAQWYDQQNNLIYHFKSYSVNYDPRGVLSSETNIPVYIDPQNPKRYYVALDKVVGMLPYIRAY